MSAAELGNVLCTTHLPDVFATPWRGMPITHEKGHYHI
jgi:hypothetical protein